MIIKRLTASFGKLSNKTLTLTNGLNIIEAPNEAGKSTYCAFIKAMLYGIHTADRDKTGYLSDKTRFRPWNGAPMAGSIELETNTISLTIQRTSDGKSPMKGFSAVYTGTSEPYGGLNSDSAGENLLGVSEAVFERSAFMSQAGIKVSQTPELENRITSLVTTGDETTSYSQADEHLRQWLRNRRFNKSGTIPSLEDTLSAVNKRLASIESALEDASATRLEVQRLKQRQTELNSELQAYDAYDAQEALRRGQAALDSARAVYNELSAHLKKSGVALTDNDISSIRGDLKALEPLKSMLSNTTQQQHAAQEKFDIALSHKKASPLFRHAAVLLILLMLISAGALAVLPSVRLPAATVTLLSIVLLVMHFLRAGHLKKQLENEVKAAQQATHAATNAYTFVYDSLLEKLNSFSLSTDIDSARREIEHIEVLLQEQAAAKADVHASESFLKSICEVASLNDEPIVVLPTPGRSRHVISSDLSFVSERLEEQLTRYNISLGEIRALGDPLILGSEKQAIEEALTTQRAQYEALSLAIETLKAANAELQSRFSPLLSNTAGQIIQRLTAGRYEKLTFDKALDASAKTADETVSRNILSLSAGTADQIYLALRLAVCDLVLPKENICPLILDDVLANFDDERARYALEYLSELAKTRQILLFTCHSREAQYIDGDSNARIIKLC